MESKWKQPVSTRIEKFLPIERLESECWNWTGFVDSHGYACAWDGSKRDKVHRIMWKLTYGTILDGLDVCHKCDNRRCVNPSHLFLGSRRDNMRDASRKGRLVKGDKFFATIKENKNGV